MLDESWWAAYITDRRSATGIAAGVERAVNAGVLTAGRALPPIRAFAGELGVNPNTVSAAYQTLRRRGVVETAGRRGTRVRPRLGSALREDIAVAVPESARDLSSGNPDPKLLPALGGPLGDAVRGAEPVLYGQPADDGELHRVATESFRVDGVPDGTVAVAGGTLDAVEKALLTRLRPGDRVAVEDPGWHALLDLLGLLGLEPHGVSVDDEGPLPDELAGALGAGARAAVVTSRAQNPFGSALGGQRAEALRGVLAAHPEVLLVEDDHGFAFTSAPFHSLAPAARDWMLVRSASKSLGPDLRIAALVGDSETVAGVRTRQRVTHGWVPHVLQRAAARLWREAGEWSRQVAASYDGRRQTLLDALTGYAVPAYGRSGLNVWVPVSEETGVVSRLQERGWAVAPGARFRLASQPGIRITTASLDPAVAPSLASDVAAALRPEPTGRGT
ncbi:DNA-binding transcriptional MocR family regulator [Lipingzhangella halophila]|uniref:DNA-binding transcriptional MocR family regulator n=1 Tax=Lipingzhangella halophila TaxID=1783352 RepID=A0A7W7RCV1_9ACTN|nr:aminotransferase class I/II-fold pyridoxal phosphate-dependent enzyme [Lipingzhangella halophila]MBB4929657.1 DNA-binding transcriptional MocR family regulator [Lipingzhangella halophila]